jgi:hypothetical protein
LIRGAGIVNPATVSVPAAGQRTWMDSQLFGTGFATPPSNGWVRLDSDSRRLASLYFVFNESLSIVDGAVAAKTPAVSFVLPEIDAAAGTEIRVANTSDVTANLALELRAADGALRTPAALRIIPASGELIESVESLFPAVQAGSTDYVSVRSDQNVVAAEWIGSIGRRAAVLHGRDAGAGAMTLYAPLYISDTAWRSTISIINLDAIAGNVGVEFRTGDGTPIGPARSFPIPPHGKLHLGDGNLLSIASPISGKAYIHIIGDGVKLTGSLVLSDRQQSRFLAAAPLFDTPQSSMIFSHIAADSRFFTGIALLNPSNEDAVVTIDVFDSSGNRIGNKSDTLKPGQCRSKLIGEHVPEISSRPLTFGYIRITSTIPIIGFGAFGTHDF